MSDVSPWYDDGGGDGDDGGGDDALSQAEANVSNYVSSSLNVRICNVTEFPFSFQIFIFSTKMWYNNLTSSHKCVDTGVSSFVAPLLLHSIYIWLTSTSSRPRKALFVRPSLADKIDSTAS